MKELLLIRHGETDLTAEKRFCGITNPPLCETGRLAVEKLRPIAFRSDDLIFASDLIRCRETAEILGTGNVEFRTDLREISFGIFENRTAHECEYLFPNEWKQWCETGSIPEGESLQSFKNRIIPFADSLLENPADRAVIITHGGVIRLILAHYILQNSDDLWRFQIEPASLTRLGIDGTYCFLKSL